MRITLIFLFLSCTLFSYGQGEEFEADEALYPLFQNRALFQRSTLLKSNDADSGIVYLLDTLELPVVDDFSQNRLKDVHLSADHPLVFDSVQAFFSVDGSFPDTGKFRFDSVAYFTSAVGGGLDTFYYDALEVILYDTAGNFQPFDTLYLYPSYNEFFLTTDTYSVELIPDTVMVNYKEVSHYALPDGRETIWVNEGGFLNNSFGVNPPTIGVMTFDGLDRLGMPYDFSFPGTYGEADRLTSKPINLGKKFNGQPFTEQDSVVLSFYYQPQGVGDDPQVEDSLILDFFDVRENEWNRVWGGNGDSLRGFRLVEILVDTNYLKKGFRFRFRNLATLSGSLDHWNIDYVRLGEKIIFSNDQLIDVSFIGESPSFIKKYRSMPWNHYLEDPEAYTVNEIPLKIRNLGTGARVLQYQFSIHNYDDTASLYSSPDSLDPSFDGKTDLEVVLPVLDVNPPFTFPDNGAERGNFLIKNSLDPFTAQNEDNDTIFHVQSFDSYYAYDDGVAERAYSINGTGALLAYRFETDVADTLTGLLINFPRMLNNELNRRINILVWNELDESPIYESGPIWEVTYPNLNDFTRYVIDEEVGVSGTFYVGWQQQDNRKIYVGWDINNNNQSEIFYNRDGEWRNTSFEGSLMIRPDFGNAQLIRAGIEEEELEEEMDRVSVNRAQVFPNPTTGYVSIRSDLQSNYVLHDTEGRLLEQGSFYGEVQLDLSRYPSGLYLLGVQSENGTFERHKVALRK